MSELEHALRGGPEVDPAAATARAVERADAAGLVDVAYTQHDSPIGRLLVAATRKGLVTISYQPRGEDAALEDIARRISPRLLELPGRLDAARRELDEYFSGARTAFEHPVDWSYASGFTKKVLRATARIPYGGLSTYSDVAARAGNRRAVRAAGRALGSNRVPIVVPCHRVVRTGGALGGYAGGLQVKEFLLALEGADPAITAP